MITIINTDALTGQARAIVKIESHFSSPPGDSYSCLLCYSEVCMS